MVKLNKILMKIIYIYNVIYYEKIIIKLFSCIINNVIKS